MVRGFKVGLEGSKWGWKVQRGLEDSKWAKKIQGVVRRFKVG